MDPLISRVGLLCLMAEVSNTAANFSPNLESKRSKILRACKSFDNLTELRICSIAVEKQPVDGSWRELPPHKDESQVDLDVNRAFVYYPQSRPEATTDYS